jgi:hypothetical protein
MGVRFGDVQDMPRTLADFHTKALVLFYFQVFVLKYEKHDSGWLQLLCIGFMALGGVGDRA